MQMQYWFDTVETIPAGVGFSHFSGYHFCWLTGLVIFTAISCLVYRRLDKGGRRKMGRIYAALIVADELFKMVMLTLGRRYLPDYLPLHLCSVNIFIIVWHTLRPNRMIDNFLYTVCIPGALAALLFPSWTSLPAGNFMHLHSFTVHILLVAYPVMLLAGGDIKPELKYLPKCLALLAVLALVALGANLIFDTNFMFLMYADPGNPLLIFENIFGSHLVGFPILIAAVVVVLYTPVVLLQHRKNKRSRIQ